MTRREREKIREAVHLLMEDDCRFERAMAILAPMAGYVYPAGNLGPSKPAPLHEIFPRSPRDP